MLRYAFTIPILLALAAAVAWSPGSGDALGTSAMMSVTPSNQSRAAGDEFDVSIAINAPSAVGAYEFTLRFDSAIVDVVSVTDGGFLTSTGRWASCFTHDLDNLLLFGCSTAGLSRPGPTGSGTLARLRLRALKPGISQLSIREKSLTNENGDPLPVSDTDGSVTVTGAPVTNTPTPPLPPLPTLPGVPPPSSTAPPTSTPFPPTATNTAASFAPPVPSSTPQPQGPTATSSPASGAGSDQKTQQATASPGEGASTTGQPTTPGSAPSQAARQVAAEDSVDGRTLGSGNVDRPQAGVLGAGQRPRIRLPDTGTGDAFDAALRESQPRAACP